MRISTTVLSVLILGIGQPATGHPRNYAAPRARAPIHIDGNIYKKSWADVPWSEDFVEIRGADAPPSANPTEKTRTRMKMAWDDKFLYIAAEMSANDWPITAEFTKRNDPIYQKDSDFEVFVDSDGSNWNYKEMELNARNTVWNLLLDKPYSSSGAEHSGRVAKPGDAMFWDVKGQKTAAKMYGKIGTPQPNGKWTSEIALSHHDTLDRTGGAAPAVGKFWRINFSRVERKGAINWVWSPQMVWTPTQGKYVGQVNMHAPDAWGYVVFAEAGAAAGTIQDWMDPDWKLKAAAHQLFYAQKFASSPAGGGQLLTTDVLKQKNWINSTLFQGLDARVRKDSKGWTANIEDSGGCVSTIQQDNFLILNCSFFAPVQLFIGLIFLVVAAGSCFFYQRNKAKAGRASD